MEGAKSCCVPACLFLQALCFSVPLRVCVCQCGFIYVSKVTQQRLQVLRGLFLCHCAECAFLNAAHIVNRHPVHSDHLPQACLGFPTQFVHKLWLPFGLPIEVTGRFVLIFVRGVSARTPLNFGCSFKGTDAKIRVDLIQRDLSVFFLSHHVGYHLMMIYPLGAIANVTGLPV